MSKTKKHIFTNNPYISGANNNLTNYSKDQKVREMVAVFQEPQQMQEAIDDLQENGIMQHEISVLAGMETIEQKMGHTYKRVESLEDDPQTPRVVFISGEDVSVAEAAAVAIPMFIAATTTAGIVVSSGGAILDAILYAAGAGAVGAGLGSILSMFIAKQRAEYLQEQVNRGGLLLWVRLRNPNMDKKTKKILLKHSAHDVHIHSLPIYR